MRLSNIAIALVLMSLSGINQRVFAGYEQEILADNPWVYYRFDETSGDVARDASGNGFNAEYVDVELGESTAGAGMGTAIRLDGVSGHVNVPPLDFESDQLTIETWVNMDFIQGACCTSVFSPTGWEEGWLHYNLGDSGGGRVEFALNNGGPNDRWTEGGTLEIEEWAHIASTYDKDEAEARMFINGEEVDFDIPTFDTPQTVQLTVEAQIGAWQDTRFLSGAMDEFAIYNTVLSPERIKAHFDSRDAVGGGPAGYESLVKSDNPFVYYRFDETEGTVAVDSSGNGHDAEYVDGVELGQTSAEAGLGTSIRLDGTGYVQVPVLDFESDQATIEMWVNLEELAGGCCTSLFSPDGWEPGWLHYNLRGDRNIEFALNGGGPNNHNTEPETVPEEEWVHIASVYDLDEALVQTFVNGEEVDVNPPDFASPDSVRSIVEAQIGAWQNTRFLIGSLDEFALYDTALTPAQIRAHFEAAPFEGGAAARLRPGDADQDLDFDQLDLVQVQIAAKYLTGNAATWGEGDWDGAPGGSVGNPPAGNGLFDQLDIIAALTGGVYLTGPYAALSDGGVEADGQTSLVYNAATGEVAVDAPAGLELTSINVDSAAGIFTGEAAQNLGGSFDNDADGNVFKATFGGSFGSLSFGNIAQTGLAKDFVLSDLTAVGSLAGGGDLGDVDLIYIPEPASALMLLIGLLVCMRRWH